MIGDLDEMRMPEIGGVELDEFILGKGVNIDMPHDLLPTQEGAHIVPETRI